MHAGQYLPPKQCVLSILEALMLNVIHGIVLMAIIGITSDKFRFGFSSESLRHEHPAQAD